MKSQDNHHTSEENRDNNCHILHSSWHSSWADHNSGPFDPQSLPWGPVGELHQSFIYFKMPWDNWTKQKNNLFEKIKQLYLFMLCLLIERSLITMNVNLTRNGTKLSIISLDLKNQDPAYSSSWLFPSYLPNRYLSKKQCREQEIWTHQRKINMPGGLAF